MSGKGVTKQVTYSFFSTLRIPFAAVGLVSCIQEFVHFIFDVKYFVYPLVVRLVLLDLSLLLVFSSSKVFVVAYLYICFYFQLWTLLYSSTCDVLLLLLFKFVYLVYFLTFFFQHLRLYAYY